jgi:hypothetical protein
MNMTNYSGLKHLLGSYLHQDFVDEFPTAMDAVRAFASGEPSESVQAAANDITMLLADEKFLRSPDSVLFELGCYYDPRSEGMTAMEWLQQAQRALRTILAS